MNYIEYLQSGGDFIIKPKWINKDLNEKYPSTGGYLKPGWVLSLEKFSDKLKDYKKLFDSIDEKNPTKNNKNSSLSYPDNIYNVIKYRLNGEIMPGYPSSEYNVFNFSTNPIKIS